MGRRRVQLLSLTAAAALAVGLAGCGGNNDGGIGKTQVRSNAEKGGTLDVLVNGTIDHLDPQRIYTGVYLTNFNRMLYRGLVSYPSGETDTTKAFTPQPDLATDTGTSSDGAKTWKFTLKSDVKWQDGSAITCADLKYGAERSLASDVIQGGPNYLVGYIDAPDYTGPYKTTAKGLAEINKAITCSGQTITYNFKKPWPDFPLALASLMEFDPYQQSKDKGDKSNYVVNSDGPYMLQGTWDPDHGGTFVRNPNWSDDDLREANPSQIDFKLGYDPQAETAIKTLINDSDPNAIVEGSSAGIPADQFPAITGAVAARSVDVESPFTNYLVPNFKRLTNEKVRQALAMATDRASYSQALGGSKISTPATSIVNPSVPGYESNSAYSTSGQPDNSGAESLLKSAGVSLPVPITFTYPLGSDASNNAFQALINNWNKVGFKVTGNGLDPNGPYYPTIQNPTAKSDITWGGWGADWPSISTVIPPLFDSRVNLTSSSSNGQDYGNFSSSKLNSEFDAASATTDLDAANQKWAAIDKQLATTVAYIPLDTTKFYYLRGSNIANYVNGPASSSYADLGVISLKDPKKS